MNLFYITLCFFFQLKPTLSIPSSSSSSSSHQDDITMTTINNNHRRYHRHYHSRRLSSKALTLQVSTGFYHTCAILNDLTLKCFGENWDGQLGIGDTDSRGSSPEEMGEALPRANITSSPSENIQFVSAGEHHTCALITTTTELSLSSSSSSSSPSLSYHDPPYTSSPPQIKCFGWNAYGQLGYGDWENRGDTTTSLGDNLPPVDLGSTITTATPTTTIATLSAGYHHTCITMTDGVAKCWGNNENGQLGLGDTDDRGDDPMEMGDYLPPIDLGAGARAVDIAAGFRHTCALLEDGLVKCWGWDAYGQLGAGISGGNETTTLVMGDERLPVDVGVDGTNVVAVRVGGYHTCVILEGGLLKCWGNNLDGQLGLEDTTPRGGNDDDMGDALPIIDLGHDSRTGEPLRVMSVALGTTHTCAIVHDESLRCWGGNAEGQLGLPRDVNWGGEAGTMGDNLPAIDVGTDRKVRQVAAGDKHTCAILDDGSLKCWGKLFENDGDDDDEIVMGDNLLPIDLGSALTIDDDAVISPPSSDDPLLNTTIQNSTTPTTNDTDLFDPNDANTSGSADKKTTNIAYHLTMGHSFVILFLYQLF